MRHLNRYIFLSLLLLTAMLSEAVQLGSAKGSAVFGRPLDLTVQVRLDAPAEEAANCFSADVFQADNKFDAGRVRLDVLPSANGVDATIRVRSVTAVNEPWAKVILRSNCGAKVSKQYDFLTDFAAEPQSSNMLAELAPAPTQSSTAAAIVTATLPALADAKSSSGSASRAQASVMARKQVSKSKTQIAATPSSGSTSVQKIKPSAVAGVASKNTTDMVTNAVGQSRLKMETFELTNEHQVMLKLSTALVAPTGMRTPEEIQALEQATAVWRAINGLPSETKATEAPTADTVAATSTKAPVAQTAPPPPLTLPTLMNQKLAGKSEFSNLMVYGLIGFLALTLGCIAWLWLRVRKASRAGYSWLNESETEDSAADHEPTQFMHSNFYETEAVGEEKFEPALDAEPMPTHAHAPEIVVDMTENDNIRPAIVSAPETPVVSALPPHFDDPRFEERVLRVKNKGLDLAHEKPITSSAELMDLVLADMPPKLRSVSSPASTSDSEFLDTANASKAKKSTTAKDDSKGTLIDFDIFAEPEPLNKPTRFVR